MQGRATQGGVMFIEAESVQKLSSFCLYMLNIRLQLPHKHEKNINK